MNLEATQMMPQGSGGPPSGMAHRAPLNLAPLQLNQNEINLFGGLFQALDAQHQGYIDGKTVSQVFITSELPKKVLAEIWKIATHGKPGPLSRDGFFVACRLIAAAQQGHPVSKETLTQHTSLSLPRLGGPAIPYYPSQNTASSTSSSLTSGPTWSISPEEERKYATYFTQADVDRDGFVNGTEAKNFFKMSKLSADALRSIWVLADFNRDNKLDRHEFMVAMHLIMKVKQEKARLPASLPSELHSFLQAPQGHSASLSPDRMQGEYRGASPLTDKVMHYDSIAQHSQAKEASPIERMRMEAQDTIRQVDSTRVALEQSKKDAEKYGREKLLLKEKIDFHTSQLETLRIQFDEYDGILQSTKSHVEEERRKVEALTSQVEELRQSMASRQNLVQTERSSIESLRQQYAALEQEERDILQSVQEEERLAESVVRESRDLDDQIGQLKDMITNQKVILDTRRDYRSTAERENSGKSQNLHQLKLELEKLKHETKKFSNEIFAASGGQSQFDAEVQQLESEVEHARKERDRASEQLASVKANLSPKPEPVSTLPPSLSTLKEEKRKPVEHDDLPSVPMKSEEEFNSEFNSDFPVFNVKEASFDMGQTSKSSSQKRKTPKLKKKASKKSLKNETKAKKEVPVEVFQDLSFGDAESKPPGIDAEWPDDDFGPDMFPDTEIPSTHTSDPMPVSVPTTDSKAEERTLGSKVDPKPEKGAELSGDDFALDNDDGFAFDAEFPQEDDWDL